MKKMRLLIIISVLLLVGCEKEEQVDEIETETDVIEYKIIFPSTDWQRIVTVFPELKM